MNDCLVFDATVGYNARLEETRLSTVKTPSPVLWLNLTRHCVPITRVTYTHSYGGARTHAPLVGHGWKESNELHVTEADRRVENKGGRNKHRLFAIWTRCVACQHNTIILWFFFCRCLSALSAQLITTTPPLSRARYKLLFIYDVPRRHWRWVHTHTTYRAGSVVPPSSTTMNIFCLFLIRPIK